MIPVDTLRHFFVSAVELLPEGGQRTARRNAWAAMSSDARRARDRREAEAVMADARRALATVGTTGGGRVSN